MRRVSFSTSVLPSVATEIFRCARSIVTASSDGSSASVSTTERARHLAAAGGRAIAGLADPLMLGILTQRKIVCDEKAGDQKRRVFDKIRLARLSIEA